jgi:nitrate reductase NapE component
MDDALSKQGVTLPERIFFKIISYLFHPLFVPLYVAAFLLYMHPGAFTGFSPAQKKQVFLIIAINIVAFPLLSVFLLRAVGFIRSVFMYTQKDRIIPYMACGIFFFWAFTVFRQQPHYPALLTSFLFGIFLASSAGLIANIYYKISIHAIGMGGLVGIMIVIFNQGSMHMTWPLSVAILLSGLVCTARLIVSDHSQKDIYTGLLAGFICQLAAALYIL